MKSKLIVVIVALMPAFMCSCQSENLSKTVKILTSKLDPDTCSWNINKDSIGIILANMTPLSGATHHCCYNNDHCEIIGKVIYDGYTYMYRLNAGGWAELVSLDYKKQFLLACTDKKYFKYFISTYDTSGY